MLNRAEQMELYRRMVKRLYDHCTEMNTVEYCESINDLLEAAIYLDYDIRRASHKINIIRQECDKKRKGL